MNEPCTWLPASSDLLLARADGVDLWLVAAGAEANASHAGELLSADELEQYGRLRNHAKRDQAIVVRGTLRIILSRYIGVEPAELQFARQPQGKPVLLSPQVPPRMEFNCSHAGAWGLVAVTATGPVGVDIEEVRPLASPEGFARKTLAPADAAKWPTLADDAARLMKLFEDWTCKEAALKAAGCGIVVGLDAVRIHAAEEQRRLVELPQAIGGTQWQVALLAPAPGFVAAVALPASVGAFTMRLFQSPQL